MTELEHNLETGAMRGQTPLGNPGSAAQGQPMAALTGLELTNEGSGILHGLLVIGQTDEMTEKKVKKLKIIY